MVIRIRYLISLCNIYYIKGETEEANKYANEAADLAGDKMNFTYETSGEAEKLKKEADSIALKCQARLKNVTALDLKMQKEEEDLKRQNIGQSKSISVGGTTASLFGIMSSSTFLMTYLYLKKFT
jgi:hypothetical protein